MSFFIKTLSRFSFKSFNFIGPLGCTHYIPVQTLYSEASLGLDGYITQRIDTYQQMANISEKFKGKMNECVNNSNGITFSKDLKNMIYLAEQADLELLEKMLKNFNLKQTEFRFGSFKFGPIVMRLYHYLDAPNEALKCYEENDNGFFDQLTTHQILLNLLFKHEMYDEIYQVYEKIKVKQLNMTKYPKYIMVLVFAACYKQNTPESYQYATKVWSDMTASGAPILRRTSCLMAGFALKQGDPRKAVDAISLQKNITYVTTRNIIVMALADMNQLSDIAAQFENSLNASTPTTRHTFFEEAITKVRDAVDKSTDENVKSKLKELEKNLRDRGLINDETLDQHLMSEIKASRNNQNEPYAARRVHTNRP